MEARIYPTWRDYDIPQRLVLGIHNTNKNNLIWFLLNDRVFRIENKINYHYECFRCGHGKVVTRQYEDYSLCEKCHHETTIGTPFLKDSCENIKLPINQTANRIVTQMILNHEKYFNVKNVDIFNLTWESNMSCFVSKFVFGEEVRESSAERAVAKAAILSPFLWDNKFNWRDGIKNDRGNDLYISHLMMQWRLL